MSPLEWGAIALGLFFVYPTVAGIVFRWLRERAGDADVPPYVEGHHLRGNRYGFGHLPCDGAQAAFDFKACERCWEATKSRSAVRAADEARRAVAWLWPVAWLWAVPDRLFNAGANVTATPTPESLPREHEVQP